MGWWMLFGGVLWVAFWGAVIYLVVRLVRGGPRAPRGEEPIEIAKRRYARGEIDKAEYDRIHHDLAA
jgi:putative membrane protein